MTPTILLISIYLGIPAIMMILARIVAEAFDREIGF